MLTGSSLLYGITALTIAWNKMLCADCGKKQSMLEQREVETNEFFRHFRELDPKRMASGSTENEELEEGGDNERDRH